MITVAGIVTGIEERIRSIETSTIAALTDPNVSGERAAFERGRLAGATEARREVRRAYEKATTTEEAP